MLKGPIVINKHINLLYLLYYMKGMRKNDLQKSDQTIITGQNNENL